MQNWVKIREIPAEQIGVAGPAAKETVSIWYMPAVDPVDPGHWGAWAAGRAYYAYSSEARLLENVRNGMTAAGFESEMVICSVFFAEDGLGASLRWGVFQVSLNNRNDFAAAFTPAPEHWCDPELIDIREYIGLPNFRISPYSPALRMKLSIAQGIIKAASEMVMDAVGMMDVLPAKTPADAFRWSSTPPGGLYVDVPPPSSTEP